MSKIDRLRDLAELAVNEVDLPFGGGNRNRNRNKSEQIAKIREQIANLRKRKSQMPAQAPDINTRIAELEKKMVSCCYVLV